ncbi:MAG: AraC family transcriptional regulator [Verrucomicrobiota bacterium]|nr:AraC family transcriptional regulator [Verrucomicrobiota bacterium]
MTQEEQLRPFFKNINIKCLCAVMETIQPVIWSGQSWCCDFWRIYYNRSAGASILVGNKGYPIDPESVLIIPAWVNFTTHTPLPLEHYFVHFCCNNLSKAMHTRIFPLPIYIPITPMVRHLLDSVQSVANAPHLEYDCAGFRILAFIHEIMGLVMEKLPRETAALAFLFLSGRHRMAEVLDIIDRNLAEPLPNKRLARLIGVCPDRFIKKFSDTLGQTPSAYVQDARIRKVAELLTGTDYSIEAIAGMTGFSDRFYMTRVFTKITGKGPAAYRRDHIPQSGK